MNSENLKNIAQAITETMQAVEGVEKNKIVGSGQSAYKGVSDQDVKKVIRAAMIKNGLSVVPIGVAANCKVERWEENYNGQPKQKQSVFTEVTTKYMLLHTSGEFITFPGYGHGIDSQDKSAGKATTYALKNALLYLFLVPTGDIDDTDSTHSKELATPPPQENPLKAMILKAEDGKKLKVLLELYKDEINASEDLKKTLKDKSQQFISKQPAQ